MISDRTMPDRKVYLLTCKAYAIRRGIGERAAKKFAKYVSDNWKRGESAPSMIDLYVEWLGKGGSRK